MANETVLLQAMKEDPPLDAKCRDKFLVQSAPVGSADEPGNIAQVVSFTRRLGACLKHQTNLG